MEQEVSLVSYPQFITIIIIILQFPWLIIMMFNLKLFHEKLQYYP
jgi:hypothetical protein